MEVSHAKGTSSKALLEDTISSSLRSTVAKYGDNEAIVAPSQDLRYTYREFDAAIDRVAKALLALGLTRGDRVGIWAPNLVEWALIQYGSARIGAILVTINPAYRRSELAFALEQSGCRALFTLTNFKSSQYKEMLSEVAPSISDLQHVVYFDNDTWTSFLEMGDSIDIKEVHALESTLSSNDPINIQYTSGTTGNPKGATLSHSNIVNNGYFVGELCRYTSEDRVCIPVPYYHCFGMVMGNLACTTHGATMVIPSPSFDPAATLSTVASEHCTSLYGVPTMFIAELALENFASYDLTSLRTGIMAGSPCPAEVMRRVIEEMHMNEVTICYGMTETSPVSCQTTTDDPFEKRIGTVGRVGPHLQVKIIEPDGSTVAPGVVGELCTKGYSVMLGYWNDPERTEISIDSDGWMHTGDLATMDASGYVSIVGRIKDLVIRGGENLYPREIEEFLYGFHKVEDVAVIGVPDPLYGEELMAWIRLKANETCTEEEIRSYCRDSIAHNKIPRYVKFTDSLPMTVTGKVQKYLMKEISIDELHLQP
jgi:fatty-acyl-CoA synthase